MGLLGEFRSGFEGFPLRIIRVVADNTAKELTLRQKYVDWGWFRKKCQGSIDLYLLPVKTLMLFEYLSERAEVANPIN